ncbi:antibiotic biosynthesis monooxygenase family protein [Pseudoclavibacter caeni]|jgi:heme-degrading monooxygenase HmoA|uniref:Antibiotic biosynthesis monooxygenase n=1 Tax=Pseudoclavibacter caeni TaxID=908846 RepID=A0A7C8FK52_9MICO|nr:antibiotic biosynthesis monooxygenase [Pseudoclavibacter caeni]KAB1631874.1 antibiotic biosynthesis monooxygenase [Pseudoclavibacter caeni]NYJ96936.1 heme-degrading monooxygenase HmoA [Pseudoclavibacter caeni]
MSYVVINALTVPAGQGPELERRFAARRHAVDGRPGFEGFQLLRPTAEDGRYLVLTQWASQEDFAAWRDSAANREAHHHSGGRAPVATGAELFEYEPVDLEALARE